MPPDFPADPRSQVPSDVQLRAFEEQETMQRIDVPSAEAYVQAARAARARGEGLSPRARIVVDWVLPAALGLLVALLLVLLSWLVFIE